MKGAEKEERAGKGPCLGKGCVRAHLHMCMGTLSPCVPWCAQVYISGCVGVYTCVYVCTSVCSHMHSTTRA